MLTDSQIKKAKPQDKAYRLVDTGGLHVFVTPSGGKLWRLRYKVDGTEKTLSLGKYPELSLAEARSARDDAKAIKRGGKDPAVQKKIEKLVGRKSHETTFEAVAREWHELQKPQWVDRHADDVIQSFRREVFPHIGTLPLSEITSPVVLGVLRLVEAKNAKETARRLRQRISSVFVYAISTGRASGDPAGPLTKALAPMKKGKQPAIVDLDDAREMLRRVEGTPSHPVTKLALRLTALTAVRPGTVVSTPWHEFADVEERRVWQIPAERMKLLRKHKDDDARDHIVPLSDQAVETIVALRMLTGKGPWVFPNGRHAHRIMSENAMGYLLNRAGYHSKHVPHGFRATFSTVMNERFPDDRRTIDFMLAHVPKDRIEAVYNRSLYLPRRVELAQLWADLILEDAPPAYSLLAGPRKILKRHA